MVRKIFVLLLLLVSCSKKSDVETIIYNDSVVEKVVQYDLTVPQVFADIVTSFDFAVGSSLQFNEVKPDGTMIFYGISDRGPNVGYELAGDGTVLSFMPEFTPFIAMIEVTPKKALVTNIIPIKFDNDKVSGLPTTGVSLHAENFIDSSLKSIDSKLMGVDSESIALDNDGGFWIGDEYGPSLIKLDKAGNIVKILSPGSGIPSTFRNSKVNRGFEAITITKDEHLFALLEAPMEVSGQAVLYDEKFIRMLELDLKSGKTRILAYQCDESVYGTAMKIKLSDLASIDNENFLVVEQGKDKNQNYRNVIYKINIADATDISDMGEGNEIDLSKVNFVKREKLLDIRQYGWTHEKMEGLTVVDDKTIAVTNDSDFGLETAELNNNCEAGQECPMITPVFSGHGTNLWVVKLKNSLTS